MSIDPRDKFFPSCPTLADYDAAVKRAADAEDHLRREVASSQALQDEVNKLEGSLDAATWSLSTLRTEALARDAVIADLLLQVENLHVQLAAGSEAVSLRDDAVSMAVNELNSSLMARRDLELSNRNLLATLAARDAQIEDLRGQVATLAVQVDAYDAAAEALVDNQ